MTCLAGIPPVKGIICSSTEQYSSQGDAKHAFLTVSTTGSTLQNLFWLFCNAMDVTPKFREHVEWHCISTKILVADCEYILGKLMFPIRMLIIPMNCLISISIRLLLFFFCFLVVEFNFDFEELFAGWGSSLQNHWMLNHLSPILLQMHNHHSSHYQTASEILHVQC